MPLSARDALMQAKTSIKAAREDSEDAVITHYRAAKNALAEVDVKKTDAAALREMIAAFQDLAVVLDNSGAQLPGKAGKCRQRADTLRQKLDGGINVSAATIAPSLVGSGFGQAIAQVGVVLLNPLASASSSSSNSTTTMASSTSAATSIRASVATAVITTSTPQQLLLPSPQAAILASPLFFRKDVNPMPYNFQLPSPNELLQTTRQLAYCLALLQASVQEDDLPPDTLKWRQHTLINSHEKDRLETMPVQIIQTFAKDTMKDAASVVEVVQLAPVLDNGHSRFLLKTFIDTVDQSEMLHLHSVEGLAKAIQGAAPGSIDSNDLVSILRSLHKRLRPTHSVSHQYHLLLAVSQVLDAMADAHIGDIGRVSLHEPLTDFLRESESNKNPYLTFQAAYATQALLNVSDGENIWHAGFRRGLLVLKGGAGFAKMPDPKEIKDALEGLERFYEAGKGGVRVLKDALEAIKNRESPIFTVKEGLKFKRAWYRALRTAESYIQTGRLVKFEDLVTTTSCRHQLMFQWGICQLLGRFAADTQWDLETRQNAVDFLGALCRTNRIWNRQKEVDQVVFDVLSNVVSNNNTHFEAAKTLLEQMGKQNTAILSITNLQSQPWNSILPADPARHTPNVTLLKAVQDRNRRHAKMENLPDFPPLPSLDDIHSALKTYHAPDLFILRVSGQELDLETCFVNLAIVEAPAHREKEKQDLKEKAAVFHRIPSFERVKYTDTKALIPLEHLFDKRRLRDGQENTPKRILVQGRAGIGKTTLCKKLVHAHQNGLWKDLFDTVLWLPLRQLRGSKSRTLERLFREKVFIAQDFDQEQVTLAHALTDCAHKGKVLFILDGLDEI
ncbi:hypothetical protein BGZ83_009995, partial [Gryganskiella cystojenkinii]